MRIPDEEIYCDEFSHERKAKEQDWVEEATQIDLARRYREYLIDRQIEGF
jgi:hypothetical protein